MTLEKICEYFNDIGILQLENLNRFLQIYNQISQNNIKSKSDKLILALFSYITLISKNEQQLYDICKSIVNSFTNNQIVYRYRALYMMNNIINSKIKSRYISFFCRLTFKRNKTIFRSKNQSPKLIKLNTRNIVKEKYRDDDIALNINSTGRIKKGKIVKKNFSKKKIPNNEDINCNNNENKKVYRTFDLQENEKECTFSPKINKNYKPKISVIKPNSLINNELESSSFFNKSNTNKSSQIYPRNITYKNSTNYANNNVINDELEKMVENMTKYSGNPNNSKYVPKKTIYRTQYNQMYPLNNSQEMPFYSDPNMNIKDNNNDLINNYVEEDYDFYQNEKDFIKKVQDKIFMMKAEKLDKISQECTFSPCINEVPKYLYERKKGENNLTDIDYEDNYVHNIYNINNKMNTNSFNNSKSFSKKRKNKFTEEFADDNYNIYPQRRKNRSKEARSYSNSKGKDNEYSVYKAKKKKLTNLFKEQYPFTPTIRENKKFQIHTTFDERQKKFLEEKQKKLKQKSDEELKGIEEMKKYYNKSKANIKELVKKLYDDEAEKIKERLKNEKEKSKKKKVIDWEKRNKINREKYPEEYKINFKPKEKKSNISISNNQINNLVNNIKKETSKSKSKSKEKDEKKNTIKINKNKNKKKKKEKILNKEDINNNQKLLLEKIKDEHVIGFKNTSIPIQNKLNIFNNDKTEPKEENNKIEKPEDKNDNLRQSESAHFDNDSIFRSSEEKINKYGNEGLLEGINKKDGIRSNAMQEIMNKLNNK